MSPASHLDLSRREREILEILYRRGAASVEDVLGEMAEPPSYSAVRALLRVLEEKGHVRHRKSGRKFVFSPTVPASRARRHAVRHVVRTFFAGSVSRCVASLIDDEGSQLSPEELDRIARLIDAARRKDGES